jgi:hypothetical protein
MLRKYTARRGEPDSAIVAGSPRLLPSSWDYVPTSLKFTIRTSKCQNHYLNSIGQSHLCCRCLHNADIYKKCVWCEGVMSVVSNGLLKSTTTMVPNVLFSVASYYLMIPACTQESTRPIAYSLLRQHHAYQHSHFGACLQGEPHVKAQFDALFHILMSVAAQLQRTE